MRNAESIGSQHLELRLACSGRQPSPYFSPEWETPGSLLVTRGEQHLYLWRHISLATTPAGERRWMSCLFSFRTAQGRRIYVYTVRCTRRGMATRRSAHAQFIYSEGRAQRCGACVKHLAAAEKMILEEQRAGSKVA